MNNLVGTLLARDAQLGRSGRALPADTATEQPTLARARSTALAFSGVMVFFPTSSKVSAVVPCCCRYASVVFSNDRDAGRGAGRTGRGCRWHRGAGRGASARGALWLRLAAESSTTAPPYAAEFISFSSRWAGSRRGRPAAKVALVAMVAVVAMGCLKVSLFVLIFPASKSPT